MYEFENETPIKGRDPTLYKIIHRCAYLDLFRIVLSAIGFQGLCCVNYKVACGQPFILEINPRFGGSLRSLFLLFHRRLKSALKDFLAFGPGAAVHSRRIVDSGLWRRFGALWDQDNFFPHSKVVRWCRRRESNPRPRDYETLALPLSHAGTLTIHVNDYRC